MSKEEIIAAAGIQAKIDTLKYQLKLEYDSFGKDILNQISMLYAESNGEIQQLKLNLDTTISSLYDAAYAEGQASTPDTGFSIPKFPEWDSHKARLKVLAIKYATDDLTKKYGPPDEDCSTYYCGWNNLRLLGEQDLARRMLLELFIPKYFTIKPSDRMHWLFLEGINELAPTQKAFIFQAAGNHGFRFGFTLPEIISYRWEREVAYAIDAIVLAQNLSYKLAPLPAPSAAWDNSNESLAFERLGILQGAHLAIWAGRSDFTYHWRDVDDRFAAKEYRINFDVSKTVWKPFYFGLIAHATIKQNATTQVIGLLADCIAIMRKSWKVDPKGSYFIYEHDVNGKMVSDQGNVAKLNGLIYPFILWVAKKTKDRGLADFAYEVFKGADTALKLGATKKETQQLIRYTDITESLFTI